ncbi:MAG: hypothetical protein AAFR61_04055 [Bacteroidota bacterium]
MIKKGIAFFSICLSLLWLSGFISAPEANLESQLDGAWAKQGPEDRTANPVQEIRLFASGYTMSTTFSPDRFIGTIGGPVEIKGDKATFLIDYNSQDGRYVGEEMTMDISFPDENTLRISGAFGGKNIDQTWKRLDSNASDLAGAWQIRARQGSDGEMRERKPGPRKTIKMITGSRFQWVAMNTETKEFKGSGGGTFTFQDGVYTENIEFFSRDQTRVGASLSFEGKVEGDDWHHSGKSSKGKDIYEIWAR